MNKADITGKKARERLSIITGHEVPCGNYEEAKSLVEEKWDLIELYPELAYYANKLCGFCQLFSDNDCKKCPLTRGNHVCACVSGNNGILEVREHYRKWYDQKTQECRNDLISAIKKFKKRMAKEIMEWEEK